MSQFVDVTPVGNMVREVSTSLTALAVQDLIWIETLDWQGARRPDYTQVVDATIWGFGYPFLDAAFIGDGAIQVRVQLGRPTDAAVDPPVVTFTTHLTIAAVGGAWAVLQGFRMPSRHVKIQIADTSNAINATYGCVFARGT